jgi:hypothetical protein
MRGGRPGSGGVGALVENRVFREPVEVRARVSTIAVATEVVGTGRVERDEHDVGRPGVAARHEPQRAEQAEHAPAGVFTNRSLRREHEPA